MTMIAALEKKNTEKDKSEIMVIKIYLWRNLREAVKDKEEEGRDNRFGEEILTPQTEEKLQWMKRGERG